MYIIFSDEREREEIGILGGAFWGSLTFSCGE